MEMRIRNVHHTTRENIKKLAKAGNMSIGQVLDAQYGEIEIPVLNTGGVWFIKGISPKIKQKIKTNALNKRMSVGDYIAFLMQDHEACDVKIDRLKDEVRDTLNDFS